MKINWKEVQKHIGRPIIITFDDHAMGGNPIMCRCIGYLASVEKNHVKIVAWDVPELSGEERRSNMEYFSILKSAILQLTPLRPTKKFG